VLDDISQPSFVQLGVAEMFSSKEMSIKVICASYIPNPIKKTQVLSPLAGWMQTVMGLRGWQSYMIEEYRVSE
jgi:hypothetical protein